MRAMFEAPAMAFSASRAAESTALVRLTASNIESRTVAESPSRTASNSARVRTSRSPSTASAQASMVSAKSAAVEGYGLRARASFSACVRCSCT